MVNQETGAEMIKINQINVKIIFFASFKELLACQSTELEVEQNSTIADICHLLAQKGDSWQTIFSEPARSVKIACNQQMAELSLVVNEADEVAFFPPVTGG